MDSEPVPTLASIRKSPKLGRVSRVSDFLTKDEQSELKKASTKGHKKKLKKFNEVDSYAAEIMARFGYDAYLAWKVGDFDDRKMKRFIYAERARARANALPLEIIVAQLVKDCIRRTKKEPKAKGPKEAANIIKQDIKTAGGE